jgi:REP element-mobilizing transposase RayT
MRYDRYGLDRRSIRLPGYDYAAGGSYFITICTHKRECLFGNVSDGQVTLNEYGEIVLEEWERSAAIRPGLVLDPYVIMPNHLHGIVTLVGDPSVGAHSCAPLPTRLHRRSRSLASFVAHPRLPPRAASTACDTAARRSGSETSRTRRAGREDFSASGLHRRQSRRWAEDEYNPSRI